MVVFFYLEREQQTFRTKPKKKRTKTQIIGTTQVTIGQASDLWETVRDELSAGAVQIPEPGSQDWQSPPVVENWLARQFKQGLPSVKQG